MIINEQIQNSHHLIRSSARSIACQRNNQQYTTTGSSPFLWHTKGWNEEVQGTARFILSNSVIERLSKALVFDVCFLLIFTCILRIVLLYEVSCHHFDKETKK